MENKMKAHAMAWRSVLPIFHPLSAFSPAKAIVCNIAVAVCIHAEFWEVLTQPVLHLRHCLQLYISHPPVVVSHQCGLVLASHVEKPCSLLMCETTLGKR